MFTKLIDLFRRRFPEKRNEAPRRPQGTREIVRLGAGGAAIQQVTSERVEYTNEVGIDRIIDLRQSVRREGASTVGFRGMLDDPPWVRFFNERATRFEFTDRDEAYETLLFPLSKCGWSTLDAN